MATMTLNPGLGGEQARIGESQRSTLLRRILAIFVALFIALAAVGGTAAAAHADDKEEDASKYSFYDAASSMASFFSITESPDAEKGINVENWGNLLGSTGSSGSMLGYLDPKLSLSSGWLNSQLSGSSDEIGYDTLHVDGAASHQGMYNYTQFGAALSGMGLDSTDNGFALSMTRGVSGLAILLLFLLSGTVDLLFRVVFSVLDFLNPFKLFYNGFYAINPELAQGMVGGDTSSWGPLSGLVSWISGWYQVLNTMAWFGVVPLFIVFFLFSVLFLRNTSKMSQVKKILIRMVYLALGLPLLGSMYSGVLNSMTNSSDNSNMGSTKVVLSTYVDFENWMMNNRLALPGGATVAWDQDAHRPTAAAEQNVRNTALAINSMPDANGNSPFAGIAPINSGATADSWSNAVMNGGDTDTSGSYEGVVNMLTSYMKGDQLSAATFETNAKGELNDLVRSKAVKASTVQDWFKFFEDEKKLNDEPKMGKAEKAPAVDENPVISIDAGTGLNASGEGATIGFGTNAGTNLACGSKVAEDDGTTTNCNMSSLAAYNYLNSDFGPTSMKMYSSSNVMSEATREIHNSVNLVGTGAMNILYWINAVVLLAAFTIIGWGYALPLIISNIRRSSQILVAVPLATIGAMGAIAKVVVYTTALILEILSTVFLYRILQEFLTWLPQIVEMPLSRILNTAGKDGASEFAKYLVGGVGVSLVGTVVGIVFTLMFSIMALRLRGSVVKGLEDGVTKIIERFFETQVAPPSAGRGGLAQAASGAGRGMAAGAGMAAGQRLMNRNGGGSGSTGASTAGRGVGPSGVKSATSGVGASRAASGLGGALGITGGSSVNTTGSAGAGGPNGEPTAGDEERLGQQVAESGRLSGNSGDPARDANGNVVTDANGNALDSQGNVVTDENGNPVSGAAASLGVSNDDIARNADGSVATDDQGNVLGADGTPLTDRDGNPITAGQANELAVADAARDANGNLVTDKDGNVMDKGGQPITDAQGNPVTEDQAHQLAVGEPARDENGKLTTDKDGNVMGADGKPLTNANGDPVSAETVQALSAGQAARDANGNLATDAKGNVLDHNGKPVTDVNGAPVGAAAGGAAAALAARGLARDEQGNPVTNAKGNLVGHDGKPVTDAKGAPIAADSRAGRSLAGPAGSTGASTGAGAKTSGSDHGAVSGRMPGARNTSSRTSASSAARGANGTAGTMRMKSTTAGSKAGVAGAAGVAAGAAAGAAAAGAAPKAPRPKASGMRAATGATGVRGGSSTSRGGSAPKAPKAATPKAPTVVSASSTSSKPAARASSRAAAPTVVGGGAVKGNAPKAATPKAPSRGTGSAQAKPKSKRSTSRAAQRRADDKRREREIIQARKDERERRKRPRR